jgi:hypothetical protein
LHRAGVAPFARARDVLQALQTTVDDDGDESKATATATAVPEEKDILSLCRLVCNEVIELEFASYDESSQNGFVAWLRCYQKAPHNLKDANGRVIWFFGAAGPLAPRVKKSVKVQARYAGGIAISSSPSSSSAPSSGAAAPAKNKTKKTKQQQQQQQLQKQTTTKKSRTKKTQKSQKTATVLGKR